MIRFHPQPDITRICPQCQIPLVVVGWYIPGMRNLADLQCQQCQQRYYSDLPTGHGLAYPMLINQISGAVIDDFGVPWFADWLRTAYNERVSTPISVKIETLRPVKIPLLLNCLDTLYGHALLKLLNAQYYLDHEPGFDLIVIIPRSLRWMIPDGVAEIWTVDLPLKSGTVWHDDLARQIAERIKPFAEGWLSVGLSHPHAQDFEITRFIPVQPFPFEQWHERLTKPTVTFIWRTDRTWEAQSVVFKFWRRVAHKLKQIYGLRLPFAEVQQHRVNQLFMRLKAQVPNLDFAVVGMGTARGCIAGITDRRTTQITAEVEQQWCQRYAESHIVIGVHGSNMLLPSAFAGTVIDLLPDDHWGNRLQDLLPKTTDLREALYRYQCLPLGSSVAMVVMVAFDLLETTGFATLNFLRPWNSHPFVRRDPTVITRRFMVITQALHQMRTGGKHADG